MLGHENTDELGQLFLLTPRQAQGLLKGRSKLAAWGGHAAAAWFAKNILHGNAESSGNGHEQIGARDATGALPKTHIGGVLSDDSGQLSLREAGALAQFAEPGDNFSHARIIRGRLKKGLATRSILLKYEQ